MWWLIAAAYVLLFAPADPDPDDEPNIERGREVTRGSTTQR